MGFYQKDMLKFSPKWLQNLAYLHSKTCKNDEYLSTSPYLNKKVPQFAQENAQENTRSTRGMIIVLIKY